MQFSDVVIPLRAAWSSPFVRWQGPTADLSSLEVAARVTGRALEERGVEWPISELVLGMTIPQRECFYGPPTLAARLGLSGISGPMIAQACATSVAALHAAAASQSVENGGSARLVVTTDRTSNGPHLVYPRSAGPGGTVESENWVLDAFGRDPNTGEGMLATAERVAGEGGFAKSQLDELTAIRYQQYADSLAEDRAFQRKWMVPIEAGSARRPELIEGDWGVRPTTLEDLEALRPASPDGVVSFGTQTHPADGAAGFILTSPTVARERGVAGPLATIISTGFARVAPGTMPKAPVPAAAAALESAGLGYSDVDVIKTHNPFAVNDLWFARETGVRSGADEPLRLQPRLRTPAGPDRRPGDHRAHVRARGAGRRYRAVHRLCRGRHGCRRGASGGRVTGPGAVADQPGVLLWTPPADARQSTEIGRYMSWLESERGRSFTGYEELWRWSVEDLEGFWSSIWDYFQIRAHTPYERVLSSRAMPGARWFEGAELNYAEHLVGQADSDACAVVAYSQTRDPIELSFEDLRDQVGRARAGLVRLGVGRGDRVVAYMPNIPETLVAFAATASLGAIWASCAPELGARSVVDRLAQLEPTVLLAVGGYGFRDRWIDRRDEVRAIRSRLPTLRHVVGLRYGSHSPEDTISWEELTSDRAELEFEPVPFDHPLYVLFSSGTTGPPKAIVHGHGGMLLEHLKSHALSWDLGPGDRLLWFTTTSWMMWNSLVSALLRRASAVMIDGDPTWPALDWQWELAGLTRPTCMGVSPTFAMASRNAGLQPGAAGCLDSIRTFPLAGSPLPAGGYRYLKEQLPADALLLNGSGGTDVCTAIVGGTRIQPVYDGEISGPCLGVAARAFDPSGREIVGELGELVITESMPSMPLGFWNDPDGSRYRAAYFEHYPGVWRHGDWIKFTPRGSCIVTGRSDATLNRGGVRLGTGEFYGVLDEIPEIADSIVVHLEDRAGGPGELLLFVVLADGAVLGGELESTIKRALTRELSPRHSPDAIVAVPAIPRTLTGKKLEAPLKRVLTGAQPEEVASLDALLDPSAFDAFVAFAAARAPST